MADMRTDGEDRLRSKITGEPGDSILGGFRTLVENSSDYIARFDLDLRYVYVNATLSQVAGTAAESFQGKSIGEIIANTDQAHYWEGHLRHTLKTREEQTVMGTFNTEEGPRYIHTRLIPEFDEHGAVVSLLSITRDVSDFVHELDQTRAELELRAHQQAVVAELGIKAFQITDIQSFMDDIVRAVAESLDVEYCKVLELLPGGEHLLLRAGTGWRDGLVGVGTVDMGSNSQAGHTLRASEPIIVRNLREETRFTGPALLTEHGITSGISVIIHTANKPYGVRGAHTRQERAFTAYDIDFMQSISNLLSSVLERRRFIAALRESEMRITSMVESAMDAIITVDENQRIILFNTAAEQLFGYDSDEAVGMSIGQLIPHELKAVARSSLRDQPVRGNVHELSGLRANGESFPVETSISQIEVEGERFITVIVRDVTQRKQMEAQLRHNEAQYRGLIESQVDLVCRYSPDSTMTYANPAFYEYYGVKPEDVIGFRFVDYPDFDAKQVILDRIEAILKDPRPITNVTQGRNAKGKTNWVQWVDYGILDEEGNVLEVQAVGRDITAQIRAETVLRAERDFSESLIDSLPGVFSLYDEDLVLLRWNRQLEEETGYSATGIQQMKPWHFFHHEERQMLEARFRDILQHGSTAFEGRLLHRDGSTAPYFFTGSRVRIGEQYCLLSVGIDISQRKDIENALRTSEARYRRLFDEAPIAIWQQDFSGMKRYLDTLVASGIRDIQSYLEANPEHITACLNLVKVNDVNKEGLRAYRADSIKAMTENFTRIADMQSHSQSRSLAALAAGHNSMEGEFINHSLDGEALTVLIKWLVMPGYEETYEQVMVTSVNITERKIAEEALGKLVSELENRVEERTAMLQEVNNELSEFAYIVSHDLKAPLRGVTQLANWLQEDYANALDKDGQTMLELMVSRAKQMHELIEGILQYSRIARTTQKYTIIDLSKLIVGILDLLAVPPSIQISIDKDMPCVYGEFTQIQQLFQNLINNAIQHMDKTDGQISIRHEEAADMWQFSISDNGPGIDPRYHEKIFRIFQTLKSRDDSESTGIGLALVKKIVERHKGQIWLESEVGHGSTFSFTLPKKEGSDA